MAKAKKKAFEWDAEDPLAKCEGETLNSWAALNDYARLGSGRSLASLLERYQTATKPPPSNRIKTLKDWSRRFEWQERVEAFDKQQNRRQLTKYEKWIDDERERRQELIEKAHEHVPELIAGMKTEEMHPSAVAEMMITLLDQSRKETADDAQRLELTGKDGGPIEQKHRTVIVLPDNKRMANDGE